MLGDYTAEAQRQKDVKSECYARMYVIMTCDVHDDMEAFLKHYPAFMAFAGEKNRRLIDSHPELTVEAIAGECGFNTPSTFYRAFRRLYGITPAEYRRIAAAGD